MRIRKNAKLTELLFPNAPAGEKLPTHVCRLNQSRWDVMNFFPEKPRPSSSRPKSDGEDSLTANGSLGDSIGAVQSSVASMEKPDFMNIDEKEEVDVRGKLEGNKESPILIDTELGSKRKDKRSSQCKTKTGDVSLLKSCGSIADPSVNQADKQPTRRGGARTTNKRSTSSSSPYEFYYYSGFGPAWSKRRGERAAEPSKTHLKNGLPPLPPAFPEAPAAITTSKSNSNNSSRTNRTSSSSSQFGSKRGFDYVDVDEDEDDDDVNGGTVKKRTRKPVKARSLKSLM
ncbi:uncharacterized protein LOC110820962 [Carica papaya]|uniref:uncharacterized protein LOC110820962 n=1 Tax=Carica papaya TaxID=3649 RepID=UPI000B8CBE2D|nr:uncharacterized protein LOC110820962 [Carica papaya]